MRKNDREGIMGIGVFAVLKGLFAAYLITFCIFIIYAALLTFTELGEDHLQTVAAVTTGLSVFVGGVVAGRCVPGRGIIWGMAEGALYGGILIGLGCFFNKGFTLGLGTGIMLSSALCGGGVGGVVGVNLKR